MPACQAAARRLFLMLGAEIYFFDLPACDVRNVHRGVAAGASRCRHAVARELSARESFL